MQAYWNATLFLSAGMIYLRDNPLLREPLKAEHVKRRLLGHWGSDPGMSLTYIHLNRLIKKYDLNVIFLAGPGHGAPALISNVYLEGAYSEIYSDISEDTDGLRRLFKQFSFPGGIGSHCTPETPGSIHEGGELGYSVSHAYGAAFDNPDLIVTVMVGDGESETGPLATAWHSNKFLNPARDGAVLPVLHLNGYKIANPPFSPASRTRSWSSCSAVTATSRISSRVPIPPACTRRWRRPWNTAYGKSGASSRRRADPASEVKRPRWPMVILRSPKGWTGPKEVDGHKVEGFWRAHQVPMAEMHENPSHLALLEEWLRSYRPQELFDETGRLLPELRELAPKGERRMGANPHANGGLLRKALRLPDFRDYAVTVEKPGTTEVGPTQILGQFLRDVARNNPTNFRVLSPDENASNRLTALYEVTKKAWLGEYFPEDADGGELAPDGRVMEMLSEHTLEGWLEGYLLTGRHGFLSSYEAFVHVIDSMFNQHAKWLEKSQRAVLARGCRLAQPADHLHRVAAGPQRLHAPGSRVPGCRRQQEPERDAHLSAAGCELPVIGCRSLPAKLQLRQCDRRRQAAASCNISTWMTAVKHCTKGAGIWQWASSDQDSEPDLVMASCGDIATMEALAATAMLRQHFPELKVRFVNVVDLFRLVPDTEHPHGFSDREFDALFTPNKPVIFNFHAYPWLIHRLTYRRTNHDNIHVRGYKEKGNINTPMELAIQNQVDRFTLAIDAIDRVPSLQVARITRARSADEPADRLPPTTPMRKGSICRRSPTGNGRFSCQSRNKTLLFFAPRTRKSNAPESRIKTASLSR